LRPPDDRGGHREDAFRGFVAILLPDTVRAEAARVAEPLRAVGGVKWVAAANYHLTLKFLGNVPRAAVGALDKSLREVAEKTRPFRVEMAELGAFPSQARPQTVWIGIDAGREPLEALARATDEACSGHGFAKEERPFRVHLTLGRAQAPAGREALAARLRAGVAEPIGGFDVDALYLMRSTLLPRGPVYSVEETFPLGTQDH
jgi:RNA 2',3'-cyclic 3'-phosphodiesterase